MIPLDQRAAVDSNFCAMRSICALVSYAQSVDTSRVHTREATRSRLARLRVAPEPVERLRTDYAPSVGLGRRREWRPLRCSSHSTRVARPYLLSIHVRVDSHGRQYECSPFLPKCSSVAGFSTSQIAQTYHPCTCSVGSFRENFEMAPTRRGRDRFRVNIVVGLRRSTRGSTQPAELRH
jgi:hypothetical protein